MLFKLNTAITASVFVGVFAMAALAGANIHDGGETRQQALTELDTLDSDLQQDFDEEGNNGIVAQFAESIAMSMMRACEWIAMTGLNFGYAYPSVAVILGKTTPVFMIGAPLLAIRSELKLLYREVRGYA